MNTLNDEIDDGTAILDTAEIELSKVTYDPSVSASIGNAARSVLGPLYMDPLGLTTDTGKAQVQKVQELLNQFWTLKADNYADYDEDGQAAWNDQDARAHTLWGKLEEQQERMTNDKAEIDAHAQTAAEAYGKAAVLVQAANIPVTSATAKAAARGVANVNRNADEAKGSFIDASYGTSFMDSTKKFFSSQGILGTPIMGIPAYIWILAGGALYIMQRAKR